MLTPSCNEKLCVKQGLCLLPFITRHPRDVCTAGFPHISYKLCKLCLPAVIFAVFLRKRFNRATAAGEKK